jgi:hypothetical protein
MAIEDAPQIDIIEFDENEAYDPERPISSLIRTQLLHLHHAEQLAIPPKQRSNININSLHTERQASEYIQKVTALLHKHGKSAAKRPKKASRKKTAVKKPAGRAKKTKTAARRRRSRR